MRRILLSLLLLGLPLAALADGVVIPATAYPAQVTIPDQRALLCWSNGVERLVIETRFVGEGTNFAWVLPLPAPPIIEEATPGLFNTLEFIFRPTIIHNLTPWYVVLLAITGLVYLLAVVRRNTPPRASDTVVAMLTALAIMPLSACAAVFLIILLPYVVWRIRAGSESPWSILIVLVVALFFGGMMLPALGSAGGAASEQGVSVLSRNIIGAYETTTITAKKTEALMDWLQSNGYVMPTAASKVVSNYVNRGWVFVATKLLRNAAGRTASMPQPFCFTFQSEKAVYPMQLTGVGSTNLSVELFVFGPLRAEAEFFRADRCDWATFPDPSDISRGRTDTLRMVHPLLRKWVDGFPVATKLHAALTPEMMAQDVELRWAPFVPLQQNIYSHWGAIMVGLNYGTAVFVGGLLLVGLVVLVRSELRPRTRWWAVLAAVAGILTTALIFVVLPKTEVRLTNRPAMHARMVLNRLGVLFLKSEASSAPSLMEARVRFKEILAKTPELTEENFLLGGAIREEDSPGNYLLRQGTNGVEFYWFDADGGEHGLER